MKAVLKTLVTVVGIPTLIAAIYFGYFASAIYVSESKFAVRSAQSAPAIGGIGALLASTGLQSSGQDSTVVVEYTRSHDMLRALADRVDFVEHYSNPSIDVLSRLSAEADRATLLQYFNEHVRIDRDSLTDVITVSVKAFDPEMARMINESVIDLSETLINELSTRIEEDAMLTARHELEIAVERVRSTAQDINRFQTANDSVSPADESAALFGRISALESRLSEARTELGELRSYIREDASEIVAIKNRINALERQLSLEKGKVTTDNAGSLGKLVESYQPLVLEQEIAQQQYASALAAMEAARVDAARQKQYMVTFVKPILPDTATEPRRLMMVLTVMIFSFIAYLIGGLLWSALRDHVGHG